jgi:hypothetical protein
MTVLAHLPNTTQPVAAYVRPEGGHLLYLPFPMRAFLAGADELANAVADLVEALTTVETAEALPDWARDLAFAEQLSVRKELGERVLALEQLGEEVGRLQSRLAALDGLKELFTAGGDQLEAVVAEVFEAMGFSPERGTIARDDMVLDLDGIPTVVEVKGKKGSAAESDAAQLEKWAAIYYERHSVAPKSLLVVNAYRTAPLDERVDPAFPDQMLPFSQMKSQCLITGIQLLGLYLDFLARKRTSEGIAQMLVQNVGPLEYVVDVESVFPSG